MRSPIFALSFMVLSCAAGAATIQPAFAKSTVETIKERGHVNCGVDTGVPGFAYQNNAGKWVGFDVDYCQALATVVLGSPDKVNYLPTTPKVRFEVLQNGDIDVLIRDTTLTFTRDTQLGLDEVVPTFYAGQGFMVRKDLGVASAKELGGATICTAMGGTLELNIADYARAHGVKINTLLFEKNAEAMAAADSGRCDGYTDDTGSLAAARSTMKNPEQWVILADVISKEPLGIHVRQGDANWTKICKWLHFALLTAEEMGVTQKNAKDLASSSKDPAVRRLLGAEGGFGTLLGLSDSWALDAIQAVGNYGEIYDRHFGDKTLALPRGPNALWTKGGLQYAYPFR